MSTRLGLFPSTSRCTRVEIKAKGKTGTLVLHYGSEGELDRLFEALKHGPAKRR